MKVPRRFVPALLLITAAGTAVGAQTQTAVRVESDLLGEKEVPADAYYGVQTVRALENFQISGRSIADYPELVSALAIVKVAAARANADLGTLTPETRDAIVAAGTAIIDGRFHDQFVVDPYQGGAGTSTNMNANEVIANVALEVTGRPLGDYDAIDPHDDVNRSQSTNDVYPTALKVAMLARNDSLLHELERLATAFRTKASAYRDVVKLGRTEMQDAVPMTVGQELAAMATALEDQVRAIERGAESLLVSHLGGTAIGTGLNAPDGFAERAAVRVSEITGRRFVVASDLIAASWDQAAFVSYSSALRGVAVTLSKIANDLILLSSGPRAGLGEISLPAVQPGSSIMPGKINPVIPELAKLVALRVLGNDHAVTLAAQAGQLQLNAYEPLEAIAILESQQLLTSTLATLREKCVDGITVNDAVLEDHIERTVGIVTALNPIIGYERATELAAEAYASGRGILEIVREEGILSESQIRELLDPATLAGLGSPR